MIDIAKHIQVAGGKKIYFASDFHFGIPDYKSSRERERLVCAWLDAISKDAQHIFLLGDLFDAWMEYKRVVPKGNVRFLGKLASLTDAGIVITVFTGNHDLWMRGYFEKELGIEVVKHAVNVSINQKIFHIGHGDGLSSMEWRYNLMKYILHHPICQWLYRRIHPNTGIAIADFFSRLGPKHKYKDLKMKPDHKEYQIQYAIQMLKHQRIDYFVFGHRHIPLHRKLLNNSEFVNLGDWINYNTYAKFDGNLMTLEKY